ncbi:uncharacterized protein PAC_15347 [Phialocephala subalpina]|uniref:Uncharacterized protein n=1 Tax=Phialocephala subalpina TaxID=576137 RepID=A0A1L7XKH9_9HELO|nr:uncharacterized protein PAC_15347 [Phialocephala subalpina]
MVEKVKPGRNSGESVRKSSSISKGTIDPMITSDDQVGFEKSSKVTHRRNNFTTEPMVVGERSVKLVEICINILLALIAMLLLCYALLAAGVHSTYYGRTTRYSVGHPILLTNVTTMNGTNYDLRLNTEGGYAYVPESQNRLNMRLLEAAKLGPTVLPIVFAAIVGNFLRLFARWKAENGSRIQSLELLLGSRSLFNTLSTVLLVQSHTLLSACLVILWCLSPLAGQASLRVLKTKNITDAHWSAPWAAWNTSAYTYDPTVYQKHDIDGSGALMLMAQWLNDVNDVGSANGQQVHKRFLTGRPFPILPAAGSDLQDLTKGATATAQVNFSSFAELRLSPPQDGGLLWTLGDEQDRSFSINRGNVSFPVSSYEFACSLKSVNIIYDSWNSSSAATSVFSNTTDIARIARSGSGFFLDTSSEFSSGPPRKQNIVFGSFANRQLTTWECSVGQETRNVTASCNLSSSIYDDDYTCGFEDAGPPTRSLWTPLSNETVAQSIYELWQKVDKGSANCSSMTEKYLVMGSVDPEIWLADLSQLDNVTFSSRFTALFNTLWMESNRCSNFNTCWRVQDAFINSTSADPMTLKPFTIMKCNWGWFGIVAFTSILLLVCSVLSVWIRYNINMPDMLGYVSSMAIEKQKSSVAEVELRYGSGMDGLERTRLMENVRVRVGDIRPNEEFGEIALAVEGQGVVVCEKGRKVI